MNCDPRSDTISRGTPNRAIQWEMSALAQVAEVVSVNGIASGHRVNRSTIVRRYVKPCDGSKGPTISM